MSQPARHLALVDAETGEVVDSRELGELQERLKKVEGDLKAAERDLRAKRRRIGELEANKARERLEHPRYEDAVRVASYWWRKCRASNRRVNYRTPDRLDAVLALMDIEEIVVDEATKRKRREPHYGMGDFKAAVDGAFFDCFVTTRRNGSEVRYDDLALICRSAAKFDEFIAKSPTPPKAVAEHPVTRNNPSRFQPHPAGSAGQARGEVYGSYSVGGRVGRVAVHAQGRRSLVRGGMVAGVAGEPAA